MDEIELLAAHLSGQRIEKRTAALLMTGISDISRKPNMQEWAKYCVNFSILSGELNPAPILESGIASNDEKYSDCGRAEFLDIAQRVDPVRGRMLLLAAKHADDTRPELYTLTIEPSAPEIHLSHPTAVTRHQLIAAFGVCAGVNDKWFTSSNTAVMGCRVSIGRRGRGGGETLYDPLQFINSVLLSSSRKMGKGATPKQVWRVLEQELPHIYTMLEDYDPRKVD